jgi:putative peptide zinc metalloprotease protein
MRVWAPFELQPHNAASMYVEVPGQLVELGVKAGERVQQGDLIARLENSELKLQVAQMKGQANVYRAQIASLERIRFVQAGRVAGDLQKLREQLAGTEDELHEKRKDLERLRIVASRDGVVIPPPRVAERPTDDDAELSSWTGTPLDRKNLGATLSPEGQENLLCMIGDPNEWDAVLVIDQDDVDLISGGQEVRLMFEDDAYHVFVSKIEEPGSDVLTMAPPRLASTNGGPLAAQPSPDGSLKPLNTSYQTIARLHNPHGTLRNGLIGRARIETPPRTLAWRLMRYLGRTFNFDI